MERSLYCSDYGASERVLFDGLGAIVRNILFRCNYKLELTQYSFFDEAPRITHRDYIPNESDVLRARTKTTGIYETRFTMGQLSIQ